MSVFAHFFVMALIDIIFFGGIFIKGLLKLAFDDASAAASASAAAADDDDNDDTYATANMHINLYI